MVAAKRLVACVLQHLLKEKSDDEVVLHDENDVGADQARAPCAPEAAPPAGISLLVVSLPFWATARPGQVSMNRRCGPLP